MEEDKVVHRNEVKGCYDIVESVYHRCKKVVKGDTRRKTTGGI